jgi:hypothetical protein
VTDQDHQKQRLAKNELAFAAYNQRRQDFEGDADEPIPIVCECGDPECIMALEVTGSRWEEVHAREDQFLVAPGHVAPDVEAVIDRRDDHWVVRKFELPNTAPGR